MITFLLSVLVIFINLFIYALRSPEYYDVSAHLYYGVMILAAIYDEHRGQRILLALTTIASWSVVMSHYGQQSHWVVASTVTGILYPFIAYFIVRTIRLLNVKQVRTEEQIKRTSAVNTDLEKRIRDQSTLFEVSEAASADIELEELFHRVMSILADRRGIYRGTLLLRKDGKLVKCAEAILGLTPAEIKRGTDSQIDEIQNKVLSSGEAIGVPHTRKPLKPIELPKAWSVRSKDNIAFWCIPLIVDEKVAGTLTIDKGSDSFATNDELRILTIIASILSQRVKIQDMIDSLVKSERLVTLGKLATTVAHEVRNPLGGIRGATQLLQMTDEGDAVSRPENAEYTNVIIREVDRLNRVIEELLAFGKPDTLNFAPHNIRHLIDDTVLICQPEFDQKHIRVDLEHQLDCPLVSINSDGLTQVLLNLFRNAVESMEDGGVLSVHTQYDNGSMMVRIRVQDSGRGISPQQASQLFDPFYTTKQKGTGLGLSISQQIVEEHGGTIGVDVTRSQGTAFVVGLPALVSNP